MPELPEVRTVSAALKKTIIGHIITDISVFWPPIASDDLSVLKGEKIIDVNSYGKIIIIKLSKHCLLVHLRMEGKFFLKPLIEPREKHEHIIFYLDDGSTLRYHDTRKFGKMYIRNEAELFTTKPLSELGKEPFTIDKTHFFALLQKHKEAIKLALLDQHLMAGIGNIYADEVLFLSRILPTRSSDTISKAEAAIIIDNSILTLNKAIKLGGTSIHTYNALGISGLFQNELLVHTKKGLPCPICGEPIAKIKVGGRGTYVCFNCQK